MTPRLILVVPVLAGGAAWLGTVTPWWVAVPVAAVVGLLIANVVWTVHRNRTTAIASAVNSWVGGTTHEPVSVPGARHWQELAIAVNALGAAYARRGGKLERERPWRAQLVDAITIPALLFDREQHVIVANDRARQHLQLAQDQRLTAVQALGSTALADAVGFAGRSGRPVEIDARVAEREVVGVASPVGDEVLLVLADRTAQRQLGRMRRDFVANASHELKTPVAGIQSLADALKVVLVRDPGRAQELAERLGDEADRLGRLVRDLLDLGRLEEDEFADREPVDLVSIAREQLEVVGEEAAGRDIDVELRAPGRATVVGVPDDLRLIVSNLVRNAVQYNRDGGRVEVVITRGQDAWELMVRDTGIGIASEDLGRVFERFYRVDVARSRETGGTGLGLALVRNAVERHGGRVTAESLLGEGSTFRVVLPVEPAGS